MADYETETVVLDEMLNKTIIEIVEIKANDASYCSSHPEELKFFFDDGMIVHFYHGQECCECVYIEDIVGDLNDLVGAPLLLAEYTSRNRSDEIDSETWTFYKFATTKGYVTIRWYGTSNGYYGEGVDIEVTYEN